MSTRFVVVVLMLIGGAQFASADVSVQLGDQDFADGDGVNGVADFDTASAGEPAPFDRFRGSDLSGGTPFSESWTFNYAADTYISANLQLGIFDHDSQAPGNQVASFGVDGHDLTALLNALFESSGGRQGENNIYTLTLPGAALLDLADGSATFSLTLQGPSLGGTALTPTPSSLPNNGAGLDFSRLRLMVPEPSAVQLMLFGSVGLVLGLRRLRQSNLRVAGVT